MSLTAAQITSDITDATKSSLILDPFSPSAAPANLFFRNDKEPLIFYPVKKTADPTRFWDGVSIPAANLLLGIGDLDLVPGAGTWDGSYNGSTSGLSALPWDMATSAFNTALANNTQITAAGGAVGTLIKTGFYRVAFNNKGARPLIQGDPTGLAPQSNVFVSREVVGDADTREVQIIQLAVRPYVYVDEWTLTPSPTATPTVISNGGVGTKASYMVVISPCYAGTFTVTLDGIDYAIPYNAQGAAFQAILGGTWSVTLINATQWAIQDTVTGAHTIATNGDNLVGFIGLQGKLKFNAGALLEAFLSTTEPQLNTFLQIRYMNAGQDEANTLLFVPVSIQRDVLSAAAVSPTNFNNFYVTFTDLQSILDTLHGFFADEEDSAQDITWTKTAPNTKVENYMLALMEGTGAYNIRLAIDTADYIAGDILELTLIYEAATVANVKVYNATFGGTKIADVDAPGADTRITLRFVFNGVSWESK